MSDAIVDSEAENHLTVNIDNDAKFAKVLRSILFNSLGEVRDITILRINRAPMDIQVIYKVNETGEIVTNATVFLTELLEYIIENTNKSILKI